MNKIASHIAQGIAVTLAIAVSFSTTGATVVDSSASSHILTVGVDAETRAFWNLTASGSDVLSSSNSSCPISDEDAACFSLSQAGRPIRTAIRAVRSGSFAAVTTDNQTVFGSSKVSFGLLYRSQALSSSSVQAEKIAAARAVMLTES